MNAFTTSTENLRVPAVGKVSLRSSGSAREMTDDPFLYNDQLQSSGNPTVGWNDVPVLLQRDIFEQLGFFRGVGFRRYGTIAINLLKTCIMNQVRCIADCFLLGFARVGKVCWTRGFVFSWWMLGSPSGAGWSRVFLRETSPGGKSLLLHS